jgi:hypothetical protein
MRSRILPLFVLLAIAVGAAHAQFIARTEALSVGIPSASLIQPADLVKLLAKKNPDKVPVVLQVGSHLFFVQAHIKGSQYAGPASQAPGLEALEMVVASLPKDKFIVIYCGCCPWMRCPNVGPAFKRLRDLGYTHVKVLYIANDFGEDWVSRGYPTEK